MKATILQEEYPLNPRAERDCLGTFVAWHRKCDIGDVNFHDKEFNKTLALAESKDVISLPVFLYEHSGQTIRTTPFSDPYDSGQVGIIFVTRADVREKFDYEVKRVTKKVKEDVLSYLEAEIEVYDAYLTGDTYGIRYTDDAEEEVETVWGYYGLKHAKSAIQWEYGVDTPITCEWGTE